MIAGLTAFFEQPPAWVEIAGYSLVALVGLELVVGKKRLALGGRGFRRTHVAIGWSIAVVLSVHSIIGVGHGLIVYLARLR